MATAPPAPAQNDQPLIEAISLATQPIHTKLNRLVLAKLPLALPPRAADPSNYVSGLVHLTAIFGTFESLWQTILDSGTVLPLPAATPWGTTTGTGLRARPELHSDLADDSLAPLADAVPPLLFSDPLCIRSGRAALGCDDDDGTALVRLSGVSGRTRSLLGHVYLPGLVRTAHLRRDIIKLTGWSDDTLDQQLRSVAESGRLGDFVLHIHHVVGRKPHVLMAYAYTLYMALLAGGRSVRASLEAAGEAFWEATPAPIKPTGTPCQRIRKPVGQQRTHGAEDIAPDELDASSLSFSHPRPPAGSDQHDTLPLQFLRLATPSSDGQDLRREFKHRLAAVAEHHLTPRERADIVQESVGIFEHTMLLVGQLDAVCRAAEDESDDDAHLRLLARSLRTPLGMRLRDSVAVAKERSRRATAATLAAAVDATARLRGTLVSEGGLPSDDEMAPGPARPKGKYVRFRDSVAVPRHAPKAGQGPEGAATRTSGRHVVLFAVLVAALIMLGLVTITRHPQLAFWA